jgi:hypothetical protein
MGTRIMGPEKMAGWSKGLPTVRVAPPIGIPELGSVHGGFGMEILR